MDEKKVLLNAKKNIETKIKFAKWEIEYADFMITRGLRMNYEMKLNDLQEAKRRKNREVAEHQVELNNINNKLRQMGEE